MSRYCQLSIEERCSIARLHEAGQSIRQIAAALDRQPSTIARELKRNSGSRIGYRPSYAQARAQARRWSGSRLERDDTLRETVLDRLARGWSPEQVSGRLAREAGHRVISHETIYRFVHAQMKRTNDTGWRRYLPRGKLKRGWRNKGGGWPRIAGRRSIHDRPDDISRRAHLGHWEWAGRGVPRTPLRSAGHCAPAHDAMLFSTQGQAILVAHERRSRLTIALRQTSLKAKPVAAALTRLLQTIPPELRQSITFDNGTEFTQHQRIARQLGLLTFFCDPRAPWQKGGVENAIGRLRRSLPRKSNLNTLQPHQLDDILANYNHTPRKCLAFQTPAEAFLQPLHFKCESTPGTSPG